MEVRPDRVRTELGVFPVDWPVLPLNRISPKQGVGLVINPSTYFDKAGTVPLLVGSHVSEGAIDASSANRISEASNASLSASRLTAGDLVTVRVGDPGVTAVVPADLDGCNCASMMIVRKHPSFNSHWLCAVMNSRLGRSQVEHVQYGTAQKQFNISDAIHFKFATPPRREQDAIAAALSDIDALLAGLDRLIAKKRDLKQAAMQQLLTGQTRLPSFGTASARLKQTEVGLVPEDWPLKRLVDLVDPLRGIRYGIVQPGKYDPSGRYMIRGQDYSEAKGWAAPSNVFRVSPNIEEPYRNSRVKAGDLIMTIVGYCGHVDVVPEWLDGANLTQTTARIAISEAKALSSFCKQVLLSTLGRRQVNSYIKGAAQPGLNCGDVERFLVPVPTTAEQAAIASVLCDMDAEVAALEARRDKTSALKQGMMQELLTGRTRLV